MCTTYYHGLKMDWRKKHHLYIFLYTVKPASSQPSAKKHWIISVNCRRPARTLIFTDRLAPRPWAQKSCQEFGGRASKSWIAVPFLGPESGSPHCIYIYVRFSLHFSSILRLFVHSQATTHGAWHPWSQRSMGIIFIDFDNSMCHPRVSMFPGKKCLSS